MYRHPNIIIPKERIKNILHGLGPRLLIGGDFNAKDKRWNCSKSNSRGRLFAKLINAEGLMVIAPSEPTYWPTHRNRSPEVLDFYIAKNLQHLKIMCNMVPELSSDHAPVIACLGVGPMCQSYDLPLINRNTNWPKFTEYMNGKYRS